MLMIQATRGIFARLVVLFGSAGIAVFGSSPAQAQTVTATQDYSVGAGGTLTSVQSGPNGASADVLPNLTDASGNSILGHTYGRVGGAFGSRASGNGVYNNTGTFTEVTNFINGGAVPVDLRLTFQLDAGALSVALPTGAVGLQSANLSVFIIAGKTTLFDYEAGMIASDPAPPAQFSESGAVLNAAGATVSAGLGSYNWNSFFGTLDAGIVQPGQSLTIQYELIASATGTTDQIPAGCKPILSAFAVGGGGGVSNCANAVGRIGDPSTITGSALTLSAVAVPEPASAGLLGIGLFALARRRRSTPALAFVDEDAFAITVKSEAFRHADGAEHLAGADV